MYEEKTYENILNSMLDRIPEDIDKREGSIIYNALAPAAFELAQAYFKLNNFLALPFIDTSEKTFLTRICSQFGVTRKAAIAAVKIGTFKGTTNTAFDVPVGSRFGIQGIVYAATKKLADGSFEMTCETAGEIGNSLSGEMLPITNISGLGNANMSSGTIVAGADVESDSDLRQRALSKIQGPSTSGSINDYKLWAMSVPGVGDVKIFPLGNGPGTVKLIIINTDKEPASDKILTDTATYIESVRPIGASVICLSAVPLNINISVAVSKAVGYTSEQLKENISNKVREYLKNTAMKQAIISYAKIGNAILDSNGVLDYSNLTVNSGTGNVAVGAEEVAVLGSVTIL